MPPSRGDLASGQRGKSASRPARQFRGDSLTFSSGARFTVETFSATLSTFSKSFQSSTLLTLNETIQARKLKTRVRFINHRPPRRIPWLHHVASLRRIARATSKFPRRGTRFTAARLAYKSPRGSLFRASPILPQAIARNVPEISPPTGYIAVRRQATEFSKRQHRPPPATIFFAREP